MTDDDKDYNDKDDDNDEDDDNDKDDECFISSLYSIPQLYR